MTGLESTGTVAADGSPEELGEVRAMRAEAAKLTAAGEYEAAASLITEAVARSGGAAARPGPASLPWRVETVALLSEFAVATMSAGALDRFREAVADLRGVLDSLGPPEALQYLAGGWCDHQNWTSDPDGQCMSKPPCPS
jgi:hypothetical protein